jgi:hypothetical protein
MMFNCPHFEALFHTENLGVYLCFFLVICFFSIFLKFLVPLDFPIMYATKLILASPRADYSALKLIGVNVVNDTVF